MNFNFFQWRSLKTRVVLFTLAIFLTSLWSLAFYASQLLRQDIQTLLGDQQFSTASYIAAEVDEGLKSRSANLKTVADAIDSGLLGKPADLQRFLERQLVLLSQFNGGIMVYRLDGVAVADVPRSAERIGVNYMGLDSVAAALKDGSSTIGRPTMGRTLRAPIFPMAVPIRDKQGTVIGALAGATNLANPNFLDKLARAQYGKSGGYVLAAPQYGLNVTATNPSRIMAALPAPGLNPTMDRYARGHEGTDVFINPLGVEVLASAKGVPVAGWYVAVTLPTSEAFAPIHAMQQRMLWATILLTLLAGG